MLRRGMILQVALITAAFGFGRATLADTTSWNVYSLEWLVDTSDAIFVAEVLGSVDTDQWGIRQRHRWKISETIKSHRDAPKGEVVLENWTQYGPGDVLVVVWNERFAKKAITTSDKNRVINTSPSARPRPSTAGGRYSLASTAIAYGGKFCSGCGDRMHPVVPDDYDSLGTASQINQTWRIARRNGIPQLQLPSRGRYGLYDVEVVRWGHLLPTPLGSRAKRDEPRRLFRSCFTAAITVNATQSVRSPPPGSDLHLP